MQHHFYLFISMADSEPALFNVCMRKICLISFTVAQNVSLDSLGTIVLLLLLLSHTHDTLAIQRVREGNPGVEGKRNDFKNDVSEAHFRKSPSFFSFRKEGDISIHMHMIN